jgi:uncharacterized protein YdhG (YjbR/CyaY superfamily)
MAILLGIFICTNRSFKTTVMKKGGVVPTTIDEYIATWPADIRDKLLSIRETIKKAAPKAEEAISYNMPTFKQDGYLVYFAAFKNHIGFFPVPSGMKAFEKELSKYKTGKGSVQFPFDQPLPLSLVAKIVKFRLLENKEKAAAKRKKVK